MQNKWPASATCNSRNSKQSHIIVKYYAVCRNVLVVIPTISLRGAHAASVTFHVKEALFVWTYKAVLAGTCLKSFGMNGEFEFTMNTIVDSPI